MIFGRKFRIVDLTHEIFHGMPGWPTHPIVEITKIREYNIDNYNVLQLKLNTHIGTHMDAPAHMIDGGKTLDEYPLEKFIGEGNVIDLSYKSFGEGIFEEDLKKFEIRQGDMVFIYTGISKHRGFNKQYLYQWPYLTPEAAKYLVSKKINVVGIDGLSIGAWGGKTPAFGPIATSALETHLILLREDILIVEEVANLDVVLNDKSEKRAFFIILPLKIRSSDGAPVRCIALLEEG